MGHKKRKPLKNNEKKNVREKNLPRQQIEYSSAGKKGTKMVIKDCRRKLTKVFDYLVKNAGLLDCEALKKSEKNQSEQNGTNVIKLEGEVRQVCDSLNSHILFK